MAVTGSISIKQNSQNISKNTSNITVTCKATMSGPSFDYYDRTGTLTIDGKDYSFTTTFPENSTKTICTKTLDITHGTDGKKTVKASFSIKTGMTGTLEGGVLEASTSKTLTNIPRASSVTCADGNIGSATTININRASSSFTHTVTYSFSGLTGTIATKTSDTSIGWTIPISFYAKIPNAKSGKVTITCDTYSGNTKVGTKTTTANVFVINSEPTINATVQDVNSSTIALTGDSNKLIKYMSNAKVDITATAKNSATIKSRKVTCGNKSGTATSNTLNGVESGTFVVSCTDSRGFSASKTITKTLVNYIKLAFTSVSLDRPTTTSNTVNAVIKGNYFNSNFGTASNTFAMKYRYRQSGGEWSSYQTVTATISNNTFTYSANLGNIYNFNNEYDFQFVIEDKLMTVTKNITVTQGIPIIDVGKNDVVINGQVFVESDIDAGELLSKFNCINVTTAGTDLNDYTETGRYFFSSATYAPDNRPVGSNGWLEVFKGSGSWVKQLWFRAGTNNSNDYNTYVRTRNASSGWSEWTDILSGHDSGWQKVTLTSDFKPYNNNTDNTPKYIKVGRMVEVLGEVSPNKTFDKNSEYTMFTLPSGYRPMYEIQTLCQGTGANKWLLTTSTDGKFKFARYGTTEYAVPSTSVWLTFHVVFFTS